MKEQLNVVRDYNITFTLDNNLIGYLLSLANWHRTEAMYNKNKKNFWHLRFNLDVDQKYSTRKLTKYTRKQSN